MERLTSLLAAMLREAARCLPPGRQQWVEAVRSEAGHTPAGWPRLRWLAGGMVLVAKEIAMVRKVVYWLGIGAVAAAAAGVVWLSWQTSPGDPAAVTDRVRVFVGLAALITLPWVGRKRGWFGPAGQSLTARLMRVAGCAGICGLGLMLLRMDRHLNARANIGPFNLPREIIAVALAAAALAVPAMIKARRPEIDPITLTSVRLLIAVLLLIAVPFQLLTVIYAAGIFAATSARAPLARATLLAGAAAGVAAALVADLAIYAMGGNDNYAFLALIGILAGQFLFAGVAGLTAARRVHATGEPAEIRTALIKQGMYAGIMAGAACGLLLSNIAVVATLVMLVLGPQAGAAGGALGGILAADRPRWSLRAKPVTAPS